MNTDQNLTLKAQLTDWTDPDGALHALAVCIGLMPADWMWVLRNAKWVFWSTNPIGEMLYEMLESLSWWCRQMQSPRPISGARGVPCLN